MRGVRWNEKKKLRVNTQIFHQLCHRNENGLEIKNYTILYIMSIHAIAVRCINATSGNVWETKK